MSRPRTPTKIIEERGGKPRDRDGEPDVPAAMPDKPKWLTGEDEKVWDCEVEKFFSMGVLTKIDGEAFGFFCSMLAAFAELKARQPLNYFEHIRIMKCAKEYGSLFGWSPADRAKLKVEKQPEQNKFQKLQLRKA